MALPLSLIMPPRSAAIADRVGLRAAQVASSSKPSATTQLQSFNAPYPLPNFRHPLMSTFQTVEPSSAIGEPQTDGVASPGLSATARAQLTIV